MTFKTLLFSFLILSQTSVYAADKNICDIMIENKDKKFTAEQIADCLASTKPGKGKSKYYEEQAKKAEKTAKKEQEEKAKEKAKQVAEAEAEERKKLREEYLETLKEKNLESKTFSAAEINYGVPVFAVEVDYNNGKQGKEKKLTDGDALCKSLGFAKAAKSIYGDAIFDEDANDNGVVIESDGTPVAFKAKKNTSGIGVKAYVSIECWKINDPDKKLTAKDLKETEDLLKSVSEDIIPRPELKKDSSAEVNDGARKPANGKPATPSSQFGYKNPYGDEAKPASGAAK